MPPPGIAGAAASGLSAMTHSVVRKRAAIDAAFCNAERVTFAVGAEPERVAAAIATAVVSLGFEHYTP